MARRLRLKETIDNTIFIPKGTILFEEQWVNLIGRDSPIDLLIGSDKNFWEDTFLDVVPENTKQDKLFELINRWNYSHKEGTLVKLHQDMPKRFFMWTPPYKEINYEDYKKGIITRCWYDLHAFGQGSLYYCEANFNGEILTGPAGIFVPLNKEI